MKKYNFLALLVLSLTLITSSCGGSKDTASKTKSGVSIDDEINQKLREYTTGGWQIHGTARTLKGKLYEHFEKLETNKNLKELIGVVTNVRSVNTARMAAINSASTQYAATASNHVKGRMMSDARLNQAAQDETDMFYAAYSSKIESMLTSHLLESFSLIQKNQNGTNNYETYFLIDEEEARKVRNAAMKAALEDSKLGIEFGNQIDAFVNENVD